MYMYTLSITCSSLTTYGSMCFTLQVEEEENPVPADRSSEKVDDGGVPSDGEGHDLLHGGRETQPVSPSPRLVKVHAWALLHNKSWRENLHVIWLLGPKLPLQKC